jgi:thiamine-phosphate pyrophosphorylase
MGPIRVIRGLYAIADTLYLDETRLTHAVEQALRGGARVIQYRDKSHSPGERTKHAAALRSACTAHRACFIVNDDIELARGARADGVHLGRHDAAIDAARDMLGADALIGVSCYNDLARAERAVAAGANYIAFGSFSPSRTKPGAVRAEPTLLHAARARFNVPLVAIGGITPENGAALIAAGADALAAISGVFDQPDVENAARRYALLFQEREQS